MEVDRLALPQWLHTMYKLSLDIIHQYWLNEQISSVESYQNKYDIIRLMPDNNNMNLLLYHSAFVFTSSNLWDIHPITTM